MSQENVEVVSRSFDAWNAGDMNACEFLAPDVYAVQDGKITAFEFSWDHAVALEAAGLSG